MGFEVQRQQRRYRRNTAGCRQELADPEGAPVKAVHPKALDHGPAQAIPGCVAQGDLAVVGPLGVEVIQKQKAAEVPQALIEEGGVVILPLACDRIVQAHPAEGLRRRAEGLPVEEVAPAAYQLADEEAHDHQIQQRGQGALFDPAVDHDADEGTDHRAIDGQAAVPDVEHRNGVLGVFAPAENAVVGPGTEDGKGGDPQDAVQDVVLRQSRPLAAMAAIDTGQQQPQGNHGPVEVDRQGSQRNGSDGVHLNAQQGKGDGGVVCGIGDHSVSSLDIGSMTQRARRCRVTARFRNASTSVLRMLL